MYFTPITRYAGYTGNSCIEAGQRLFATDGTPTALEIHSAVSAGHRVAFLTEALFTGRLDAAMVENPVIASALTEGEGYQITFEGGRSVTLTGAHRLPRGTPMLDELSYTEELAADWIARRSRDAVYEQRTVAVRVQSIARADELRPGDRLLDGTVVAVRRLGTIRAVRLWTAVPGWVETADKLLIGTRWHEEALANGWASFAADGQALGLTVPTVLPYLSVVCDDTHLPGGKRHVHNDGPIAWRAGLEMAIRDTREWGLGPVTASVARLDPARDGATVQRGWRAAPAFRRPAAALAQRPFEALAAIRRDAALVASKDLVVAA